jgi:hypothetical protein
MPGFEGRGPVLADFALSGHAPRLSKLDFNQPASKASPRFLGLVPGSLTDD